MAKKEENKQEESKQEEQRLDKQALEQIAIEQEYERLAQEAPVRTVTLPEIAKSEGGGKTLAEALSMSEDLTDLQYAMAKLFPSSIDFHSAMIARIDPNVFIPMLHLMSVDEIMRSDPEVMIDVDLIYMKNYMLLSIGTDGMGRIDTAELLGAAREEKRAERLLGGRL